MGQPTGRGHCEYLGVMRSKTLEVRRCNDDKEKCQLYCPIESNVVL